MTHQYHVNLSILEGNPGASARRPWAALALGVLALALMALAAPAYAAEGDIEAACNCAAHADTLPRFDATKLVDDPANGAMSLAQAVFYQAQAGGDDSTVWADAPAGFAAASQAADADLSRFHAAKPIVDPANGAMSLAQAEFYLAHGETDAQPDFDADTARYQALGEFYLATGVQRGIEADAARYQALGEFYLAQSSADDATVWLDAPAGFAVASQAADADLARFHAAKPVADPANGAMSLSEAEFYLAQVGAEPAAADCTYLPEALARFHRAKPVADPLNGALSLAEAEFYVAQYGADGNSTLVQAGASQLLCSIGSVTAMP